MGVGPGMCGKDVGWVFLSKVQSGEGLWTDTEVLGSLSRLGLGAEGRVVLLRAGLSSRPNAFFLCCSGTVFLR